MNKQNWLVFICIFFSFFLACSEPGEEKGPAPGTVVIIDDFTTYTIADPVNPPDPKNPPVPPNGDIGWVYGCETDYPGGDNRGVEIVKAMGRNALVIMDDIYGAERTYGVGWTGYSFAQISFTALAAGTLSFDYFHKGWASAPEVDLEFTMEFWKNYTGDIATATNPDWENDKAALVYTTHDIEFDQAGTYTLTWRFEKNSIEDEDETRISNIRFTY